MYLVVLSRANRFSHVATYNPPLNKMYIFLPSPPVTEKGILTETSQRSQCTWLCQLFCRSFDSHQQQEQHVKTHTAIFSKARESLEKGGSQIKHYSQELPLVTREKKNKKNEWRKERRLTNKVPSHNPSQTIGPICTNAQSLQWRKSLVSTGGCWSQSVLRLYSVIS